MKRSLDGTGRVLIERDPEERAPIVRRLRRVEGQIRGLIEMVERDRYCGDELQQLAAARAALRELATLLTGQHLEAAMAVAREGGDPALAVEDMRRVLRAAFRQN